MPKFSDIEVIALSLTAESLGIVIVRTIYSQSSIRNTVMILRGLLAEGNIMTAESTK